eukprot:581332-Amphidinium_carterae.2
MPTIATPECHFDHSAGRTLYTHAAAVQKARCKHGYAEDAAPGQVCVLAPAATLCPSTAC